MKKFFLTLLAGCLVCSMSAQVLMTIDDEPVYVSEFLYIYEKNNQDASTEQKSLDEYLELFTNFKLKVAEAKAEHIDTTAAFAEELRGYRAQVTDRYLRDQEAIDSLAQLSYYRMNHMRRAAHIAVRCGQDATDSARVAARALIESLRRSIVTEKADFYEVAMEHSQDPNKEKHGVELGWIIPFRYIYSIEDAVYNTPVGEVTEVFETPFGYHIALVEEEEQQTEEVSAAHIMKMVPRGDASKEAAAKHAIDSLYQVLQQGADFGKTAINESDDRGSAQRGGELGYFTRGMMVTPFEQTAFALNPGEMSKPFRSDFGWHIIYLYDRRKIQPFDSIKTQIYKNVERDDRIKEAQKSFIRKTRSEYGLPATMSDDEVLAYADAHLEEKYEDLRNLVREYHDGILLFDISLNRVWDKASKDTEGLERYFNEHRQDYTWDEPRYKGFVIYAKDKASARRAQTIIKTVPADSVQSVIRSRINNDSIQLVGVERGLWRPGQNSTVDKFGFRMRKTQYVPSEEFPVVKLVGKVLTAPEVYTDERGKVVTDYQDMLEREWVEELKTKHKVVLNQSVWNDLKARY